MDRVEYQKEGGVGLAGQKEVVATIWEAEEGISRLRRNPTEGEYSAEVERQQAVADRSYSAVCQHFLPDELTPQNRQEKIKRG